MSGLCGWVGEADPELLERMLERLPQRGTHSQRAFPPGAAIGYRSWAARPSHAPSIAQRGAMTLACAGELAPSPAGGPAQALLDQLERAEPELAQLDGNFVAVAWDATHERLRTLCDPFGLRSLYCVELRGVTYFASEIKALLALPQLVVELDPLAIESFLTFSFVVGDRTPIRGLRRLPPGQLHELRRGSWRARPYLRLLEAVDTTLEDDAAAAASVDAAALAAVEARLPTREHVGLYLSGGLDSSAVGCWLRELGVRPQAYTLDFGEHSVEREQAELVARHLELPLRLVDASPEAVAPHLHELAWRLDLPFGDGVTGPHCLLAAAAAADGCTAVFNGEGGDQLYGGWTNKPMLSAELYAPSSTTLQRAHSHLLTYHRFYGLEDDLYAPGFAAAVAEARPEGSDPRLERLLHELGHPDVHTFMGRLRRADIGIKGHDNIQPRAERIAGSFGLDLREPLFDRAMAEASFRLPPRQKLHGVVEKFALKQAMSGRLPDEIVWRKKSGMCVPTSDWVLGPLRELARELLGPRVIRERGLFRPDYVQQLRGGRDHSNEIRPRRIGEKLWALVMLELWLRVYIDGRGARPQELR